MLEDRLLPTPPVVIGFVAIITGAYIIYQCFFSPLAGIPGPFIAKLTGLYHAHLANQGTLHRDLIALHRKYGKVVRIGRNVLSVEEAAAFQQIYKAGNRFYKAKSYGVIQGKRPFDLAGERNEKIHSEQRRLVARAYAMDSMVYLEPHVDAVIKELVDRLRGLKSQPIDLGSWMQLFAFDVVGAVSFSRPFGYIETGDDGGIFLKIQNAMKSIGWARHASFIFHAHQKLMPIIGNWLASNDRNTYFFEFARREIKARVERGGDYKDIASQLLSVQKVKPELNDINISFMMTSNVFAGSDTTSTSLRSIFYMLLKHPAAYKRLVDELDDMRRKGALSYPATFKEGESSPYLQAVIHEAMRLYPSTGDILDRDVPEGGMTIDGHFVPAGTVVGSSPWVIHRSADIWGPDVDEFRPERWLDKENEGNLKRYFFVFGGGSRVCLGRNISMLEVNKLVPTLLMCFNMKLADDVTELGENYGSIVFLTGLKVHIAPRELQID
ncbi:cytochrome P450 [Hypoxylon trugodes]|uniref:cytochrome P450 n=1 Tax=Hypoxylon trugodes TaxID=326681 RepID=UPI00218DF42B|nr:cytochrome P450 [Hypoxylon trugodes]KAI1383967.1 cytochrome P450 [Hypoxylon trugodes]